MINNVSYKKGKMADNFLTIKEICDLLKVSRGTVSRWILRRQLRSHKIGRLVRIKSQDLGHFVEARPFKKKTRLFRRHRS